MKGDKYFIIKGYKVFRGESAIGEPMDEPNEQTLFGWLQTGGRFSEDEAGKIIEDVNYRGEVKITLP
jgi:hypothetical protein